MNVFFLEMNPNFFLAWTLCLFSAFASSRFLLVHVAENRGSKLRLYPTNNEKNLTLKNDQEPMHIENRGKIQKNIDKVYYFLFFNLLLLYDQEI